MAQPFSSPAVPAEEEAALQNTLEQLLTQPENEIVEF